MPIYEYQCEKCGTFEVTQRITEKALGKCPTCRGKVKKLISNTSFQLKGTGWYITDYARKGGDNKGEGSAKNGSESSGESKKSESKKTESSTKSSGDKSSAASSSAAS